MNNTAKQAGQTTRDIAQKIAQQAIREPLEIFKNAEAQVAGIKPQESQTGFQEKQNLQEKNLTDQEKLKDMAFTNRRVQALQNEINDIRKQDLFSNLQRKISEGGEVFLEEYTELSMEQKQVLKAQMEAVKNQREKMMAQSVNEVPAIHSKPSRRFGAGQKQEAEKAQTRVEKPVPPSG